MKRAAIAVVLLVAALTAWWFFYLHGPRETPQGQPPLAHLTPETFASIERSFNDASDRVRVLVMLSPT